MTKRCTYLFSNCSLQDHGSKFWCHDLNGALVFKAEKLCPFNPLFVQCRHQRSLAFCILRVPPETRSFEPIMRS